MNTDKRTDKRTDLMPVAHRCIRLLEKSLMTKYITMLTTHDCGDSSFYNAIATTVNNQLFIDYEMSFEDLSNANQMKLFLTVIGGLDLSGKEKENLMVTFVNTFGTESRVILN